MYLGQRVRLRMTQRFMFEPAGPRNLGPGIWGRTVPGAIYPGRRAQISDTLRYEMKECDKEAPDI